MSLQEQMARYRAARSMGQAQAAESAGISVQTWCNVERGQQKPSRLTEAKIKLLLEKGGENASQHNTYQNV